MIDGRKRQIGPAHFAPAEAQAFERLRRRDFVDQMAIDVEERATVFELAHHVRVPHLVQQGPWDVIGGS